MKTQRFFYRSLDQLCQDIAGRKLDLPATDNLAVLGTPVQFGRLTVPNRFAIHPMEGCDGEEDGSPGDLTIRRYRRFAAGGAGLIWWEACAVVPEGRANPRQIWLHEKTVDSFKRMLNEAKAAARQANGYEPVCVLQLTHSGRYSRPVQAAAPIIAHHSAVLDPKHNLPPDYPLITDDQLDALREAFVKAALLAAEAGFDGVDVKSCHRYLLSELLASFTREDSRYGGSYENRTRMIRQTVADIRKAAGGRLEVTSRLNVYDAIEYPFGWGVDRADASKPDLSEPLQLIGQLRDLGFGGLNVTVANPYFNPYVNRPADWMISNWPEPPEHPLAGVARLLGVAATVQKAYPDLAVIGTGYSWLRQYMPYFAAAAIVDGRTSMVGLGRGALAYPDFARDILQHGRMNAHKVCVACSSCTQIMRDGGRSGCVVRDADVYAPIFRQGRQRDPAVVRQLASRCRVCSDPMCSAACPAGVDVPGFLSALADGNDREAYQILRKNNILPGICGAVCPVEVQCQSACIQNYLSEGPVPIAQIQRSLSQRAVEQGWASLEVPAKASGRKIAIVGAGPAGLSAAAELLRLGHSVTIIDRAKTPGGKLGSVIPATRLSAQSAQAEIDAIFRGVKPKRLAWRYGASLGPQCTLENLLAEGFDAVVLAMGLGNSAGLTAGGRPEGVMDADAFLRHMNANADHRCPPRVAVIGGGNTAVDAAVCAAHRGATDVYLVYRRSYQQMPAWPKERDEALHAGVHLMLLCQPKEYLSNAAGRLRGVRAVHTRLGDVGPGGRRSPVEVPGGEFTLDVDMVVEATGEQIDPILANVLAGVEMTDDGLVKADPVTQATSRANVWAAGDIVNGGATVVQAVAEGRRAAIDIDRELTAPSSRAS